MNFALWLKTQNLHNPADQLMYFLKRPGFIFLFSFSSTLTIKTVVIILNKVIYISLLNLMALYWSAGVTLSSLNHWRGRGAFLGSSDLCSIYDALVKVFTDSWKDVFKIEMRHSEGEWKTEKHWCHAPMRTHAHLSCQPFQTATDSFRSLVGMLSCCYATWMSICRRNRRVMDICGVWEWENSPLHSLFFISLCS